MKNRTCLSHPSSGHFQMRCAFVDNFEFAISTGKVFHVCIWWSGCQCCSDSAVSWNLIGSISCIWLWWDGCQGCRLSLQLFCLGWWISSSSLQCTVCRQCTTWVLCGSCLSQFQICVCVSWLVSLLSVSKFSLHQSTSIVTKSLSNPQGSSCQLKRKMQTAVSIYWTGTRVLHWDSTDTLILQLLKGSMKQCIFPSNQWDLQQRHRPLFPWDAEE